MLWEISMAPVTLCAFATHRKVGPHVYIKHGASQLSLNPSYEFSSHPLSHPLDPSQFNIFYCNAGSGHRSSYLLWFPELLYDTAWAMQGTSAKWWKSGFGTCFGLHSGRPNIDLENPEIIAVTWARLSVECGCTFMEITSLYKRTHKKENGWSK